jgi:phage replication initiation protein
MSTLVLDGSEIKARLLAERTASNSVVHVDWVRFTCLLRNAPAPSIDDLFPAPSGPQFAPNVTSTTRNSAS